MVLPRPNFDLKTNIFRGPVKTIGTDLAITSLHIPPGGLVPLLMNPGRFFFAFFLVYNKFLKAKYTKSMAFSHTLRLFCLSTLSVALLIPATAMALRVMVDPGHGGIDAGANRENFREADLTLKVARKLKERFRSSSEIVILMTRDQDVSLGLKERVDLATSQNADLFLSIHANASTDPKANGAEFYFQNQLESDGTTPFMAHQENQKAQSGELSTTNVVDLSPFNSDLRQIFLDLLEQSRVRQSFSLSKALREHWQASAKSRSTSLKQAPFHVVSRTPMPSSLVEMGFLTNTSDYKNFQSEAYLERIADSLAQGLLAYKSHHKTR